MENSNILKQIPKEHQIRREIRQALFGQKLFCPHCGSPQVKKYGKRYKCKLCRKSFSLTSVSWLKGMKLSLINLWLLLRCWTEKIPVDQAGKFCGLSEVTVRRWYEKFRNHLPIDKIEDIRLSGVIQMDEAYRGGKKNGYAILGAKQEANGQARKKMFLKVLFKPSADRQDAVEFLGQTIKPASQLNTDGAAIYKSIGNYWPVSHKYDIHKKFQFGLTSEIEGLWGNLFTFIRRMYHHVTKQNIESVVQEFAARAMFPNWFYTPAGYLAAAFNRLSRPKRKEWRGQYQSKKKVEKNFSLEIAISPFVCLPKALVAVPS